ncbi:MAG: ATP-binding protein [Clostridia bacterium]|nr:ATP-binding protein [Clostridia bacterium]
MITKEITYKKAFENKQQALRERQTEYQKRLSKAYYENPRLAEIDQKLSQAGAQLALTALSGDKEKLEALKRLTEALSAEKAMLLKKAGVGKLQYACELCGDTGYVSGKICECIKKEAAAVMSAELSKEMPLSGSSFEAFDLKYYPDKTDKDGANPRRRMTSILNLCKAYAQSFDPAASSNLLFMGDTGLGKTHLTLAIVSEVIKKGCLPVYGSAENLFSAIEAEKFSGEGRGTYDAMLHCDLLVIDDLGAEMTTSFTKSVLYNLINTRLLSKKPTIINTNLTMKQLEALYTPRVSSRLVGNYDGQRFLGKDIRQQKMLEKS